MSHPSSRRSFFFWFIALLGTVAGLLAGLPLVGYFFSARRRETAWLTLGPVDRFAIGEMQLARCHNPQPLDGDIAAPETHVYVRREEPSEDGAARFVVFAINCTHAGCVVEWTPESDSFECPCHGGVFDADGNRLSGPPQRGLFQCAWRTRGEQLEIRPLRYSTLEEIRLDPSRCE
jgi:Rieske Fe-S protein